MRLTVDARSVTYAYSWHVVQLTYWHYLLISSLRAGSVYVCRIIYFLHTDFPLKEVGGFLSMSIEERTGEQREAHSENEPVDKAVVEFQRTVSALLRKGPAGEEFFHDICAIYALKEPSEDALVEYFRAITQKEARKRMMTKVSNAICRARIAR